MAVSGIAPTISHPPPSISHPPPSISQPGALTVQRFGGPSASEPRSAPVQDAVCGQPSLGGVGLGPVLVPLEHCRCSLGVVGAGEEPRATGKRIGRLRPRLLLQQVGRFLGTLPLEPLLGCDGHRVLLLAAVLAQAAPPSAGVCGLEHAGHAVASWLWRGCCQCAACSRCSCLLWWCRWVLSLGRLAAVPVVLVCQPAGDAAGWQWQAAEKHPGLPPPCLLHELSSLHQRRHGVLGRLAAVPVVLVCQPAGDAARWQWQAAEKHLGLPPSCLLHQTCSAGRWRCRGSQGGGQHQAAEVHPGLPPPHLFHQMCGAGRQRCGGSQGGRLRQLRGCRQVLVVLGDLQSTRRF
ncbi:uncharacterized protein [Excalfactoria chinensis]|uniref:uncharacterized protein n=1 Tax=Excalfactoria chinensis TaxID=46218 RepID=UPI003B3BBCCD